MKKTALVLIIIAAGAIGYVFWGPALTPNRGTVQGPGSDGADSARALITGDVSHVVLHDKPRAIPDNVPYMAEDGSEHVLSEHRGQVVLLNFWATWCPPCRREMPAFEELQAMLADRPFVMLPISTDRGGMAKSRAFYDEIGIEDLPLYWDEGQDLMRAFAAYGKPVTILIDHKGREVARLSGPAEWASADARALIGHFTARAAAGFDGSP